MLIDNYLIKSYASNDGTICIETSDIDDDNVVIDDDVLSKLTTKYIKSRWYNQKDWFIFERYNNTLKIALHVFDCDDGKLMVDKKKYDVFVRRNISTICSSDIIVKHNDTVVNFSEVVSPIVFFLNNKGLFN